MMGLEAEPRICARPHGHRQRCLIRDQQGDAQGVDKVSEIIRKCKRFYLIVFTLIFWIKSVPWEHS